MRFTSTFLTVALLSLLVASTSAAPSQMPSEAQTATVDYVGISDLHNGQVLARWLGTERTPQTVSHIKLVNNASGFGRFLQFFIQRGHETEPIPSSGWGQIASLESGKNLTLPLQPFGTLRRFALFGRIPTVGGRFEQGWCHTRHLSLER